MQNPDWPGAPAAAGLMIPTVAVNQISEPIGESSGFRIGAVDDPAWMAFMQAHADATVFHHAAWIDLIATAYRFQPVIAVQVDAHGRILAGLPVMTIRSGLLGTGLVALPFTDYCPPLGRDDASLAALTAGLVDWNVRLRARRFDVHAALPAADGVHSFQVGQRHLLSLDGGQPGVDRSLKGTPVETAIRKARREGVKIRLTRDSQDVDVFYRLHWHTRRRLGVPIQPRRFIKAFWMKLLERQLGFAVLAYHAEEPIAAAVFLTWNGIVIYKYGASDPRYWDLRPNNLVMWTAIEWACAHGYRLLDFGRTDSNNKGLREFKRRWGATEVPLVYTRVGARAPKPSRQLDVRTLGYVIRRSPPIVGRAIGELLYGHFAGLVEGAGKSPTLRDRVGA